MDKLPLFFKDEDGQWHLFPIRLFNQNQDGLWVLTELDWYRYATNKERHVITKVSHKLYFMPGKDAWYLKDD